MFRFTLKTAIAAGSVYYLSNEGIWKESAQSIKTYEKVKAVAAPYAREISAKLPFEIPDLPKENQVSYIACNYWNKGVLFVFEHLSRLPEHVEYYCKKGYDAAYPEIKKMLTSTSDSGKS